MSRKISHLVFSLMLALTASFLPTRISLATSLNVNSTADAVDASPGDGVCDTGTGDCTLRAAIQEANALAGDDTITLPAGVYILTIAGTDEDAATTGDLDITSNITINGASVNSTIIDANGTDRVFDVVGSVTVNISNVTIQNGNANFGGGIINFGILTVTDIIISSNSAFFGGGFYNLGMLTAINTTISENSVTGVGGGAGNNFGTLTLSNSTIRGNIASGGAAGIQTQGGTLTLINSTVSNNIGTGGGGGIHNSSDGMVMLINSAIINNTTTDSSGGGMEHNSGTLTVTNSTFSGNRAAFGGGLSVGGSASLNNVTIANNTATILGGGLMGMVSSENTIVARNFDPNGFQDCYGTLNSQGYNLIGNSSGCTITPTSGDLIDIDPLLDTLQDNGGPTFTHALLPGSPAIDAGNPSGCMDQDGNPLTTDQRGVTRPQGTACDIGAFEVEYQVVNVNIDSKPGSDPNSINCSNAYAVIPVSILTTDTFDATTVDHTTVSFEGASETHVNKKTGEAIRHVEDVDLDGDMDLVFHFRLGDTALTCEATEGTLTGETYDGMPIEGSDSIRMINPEGS